MKNSVSPAVMGLIIVVVVAIVAFIGYKVFAPGQYGSSEEMKHKYSPNGQGQGLGNNKAPGPPPGQGGGSSGYRSMMGGQR